MVTCFPFMVTVLSILRQAIGVQQAPPNMMIVSLALFLTWFVMEPVFTQAWDNGIQPMVDGKLAPEDAFAPGDGAVPRASWTAASIPAPSRMLTEAAPAAAGGGRRDAAVDRWCRPSCSARSSAASRSAS